MLVRLIDLLKTRGVTSFLVDLVHGGSALESTDVRVSSLVDTWLFVKSMEANGERNRGLYVLKSRGMAHSNQIREFLLTDRGIQLVEPYVGPDGVLSGTARLARENEESREKRRRQAEVEARRRLIARKRAALEEQISKLRSDFAAEEQELLQSSEQAEDEERERNSARQRMAKLRGATPVDAERRETKSQSRSKGNHGSA